MEAEMERASGAAATSESPYQELEQQQQQQQLLPKLPKLPEANATPLPVPDVQCATASQTRDLTFPATGSATALAAPLSPPAATKQEGDGGGAGGAGGAGAGRRSGTSTTMGTAPATGRGAAAGQTNARGGRGSQSQESVQHEGRGSCGGHVGGGGAIGIGSPGGLGGGSDTNTNTNTNTNAGTGGGGGGVVFLEGHCFADLCLGPSSQGPGSRRARLQQLPQAKDMMLKVMPPTTTTATTKAMPTTAATAAATTTTATTATTTTSKTKKVAAGLELDEGVDVGALALSDQLPRPRTFDPAPFFPGRSPPGRRRQWGSSTTGGGSSSARGGGIIVGAGAWGSAFNESPLGSALSRSRRLEKELDDLREAYARKLAHTELQCEMRMKEKDDEMQAWFRDQRIDISKMKGGVVIMQALWRRLFKRHNDSRKEEQKHFEHTRAHLESENTRLDAAHREALETGARKLQEQEAHYEQRLAELESQRASLEETLRQTQENLREEKSANAKLQEANQQLRVENYNLNKKLADDEKAGELLRKQAMIDSLELELQRTREMLEKKAKGEAEALRKELMDYVRFIVHILPDDIRAAVGPLSDNRDTIPEDLREKLLAKIAKDRRRSPPKSPPPWQDVSALPPPLSKPSSPVRSFRSR